MAFYTASNIKKGNHLSIHAMASASNNMVGRKTIVAAALLYFIVPIDTIPDLAPLFGYMDDLGVIMATLKFLGSELIPYYN